MTTNHRQRITSLGGRSATTSSTSPSVARAALELGRQFLDDDPLELTDAGLELVADVLDAASVCGHLRVDPTQVAVARLECDRVDCRRCCRTARKTPAARAGRCDLCRSRNLTGSWSSLAAVVDQVLVLGTVCPRCAVVAGADQ